MHSVCGTTNFYRKMDDIASKPCIQCQIIDAQSVLGGQFATINTKYKYKTAQKHHFKEQTS